MLHRIRYSLNQKPDDKMGGGPIEIDESYDGGEPKNRHANKRTTTRKYVTNKYGFKVINPEYKSEAGRGSRKVPVFGMLDRDTRQIRAQVLPEVRRDLLLNAILQNVQEDGTIYSDSFNAYFPLKQ
jgi:hypothetical protein